MVYALGVCECGYCAYVWIYNVEEARRQQRDYLAENFFAISLVDT